MKRCLTSTRSRVGRAGSSQALRPHVLAIAKDRRLRLHFAISRAGPCLLAGVKPRLHHAARWRGGVVAARGTRTGSPAVVFRWARRTTRDAGGAPCAAYVLSV